jgi:Fe-S-cluster containining protein
VGWKDEPLRRELLAIYREVDELHAPLTCADSADCCRFGVTGREPYPTAVELAEVEHAMRASPLPKKRLVMAAECPLLDGGRCRIYASRPFGCRTFFCENVEGKLPSRSKVQELSRRVADLSARYAPRDPGARPLTKALAIKRQRVALRRA